MAATGSIEGNCRLVRLVQKTSLPRGGCHGDRRCLRGKDQLLGASGACRAWRADRHYAAWQARCPADAARRSTKGKVSDAMAKLRELRKEPPLAGSPGRNCGTQAASTDHAGRRRLDRAYLVLRGRSDGGETEAIRRASRRRRGLRADLWRLEGRQCPAAGSTARAAGSRRAADALTMRRISRLAIRINGTLATLDPCLGACPPGIWALPSPPDSGSSVNRTRPNEVAIELNAVLVALIDDAPQVLTLQEARCCPPVRSRATIRPCRPACAPGSSARPVIRWAMSSSSTPLPTATGRRQAGWRIVSISYLGLTRERAAGRQARAELAELVSLLPLGGSARRPAQLLAARSCRVCQAGSSGAASLRPSASGGSGSTITFRLEGARGTRSWCCSATSCFTRRGWCRKRGAAAPAVADPVPGRADAARPSPHPRHRHRAAARQDQIPARSCSS